MNTVLIKLAPGSGCEHTHPPGSECVLAERDAVSPGDQSPFDNQRSGELYIKYYLLLFFQEFPEPVMSQPTFVYATPGRPKPGSKAGRVWDIADRLSRQQGGRAPLKDVVAAYLAEGGEQNTATTNYYHWKKQFDARPGTPTLDVADTSDPPLYELEPMPMTITPEGTLQLPPRMLAAMGLDTSRRVTVRIEGGELRITSPRVALRRAREQARETRKPDESVVDAFLAERRATWGEP